MSNCISVQNVTLWQATRHKLLIRIILGFEESSSMEMRFMRSSCSDCGKYFLTFSIRMKLMLLRISKCLGSNLPKRSTGHFSIWDSLMLNIAHENVWFIAFQAFYQFISYSSISNRSISKIAIAAWVSWRWMAFFYSNSLNCVAKEYYF